MLGVLTTLPCHQVWVDIEREACRTRVATRELGIDINGFILTTSLHRALTIGIIPVVAHKAILIGCKESVFFVPLVLLLGCLFIFLAIMLYTRGVDVDKVSVGIIGVLVSVVDVRAVRRGFFRAVVDVTNTGQLELLALIIIVCVGEVIACIESAVELYVTLREVLLLARDAVHVVVAHGKGVRCRLIVRSPISTRCACQTVQWIVGITVAHLSTCLATLREWSIVLYAEYVAHGIIAVGIVHNGACLGIDHEILQSATLWVIGVEGLRSVTVFEISALLELIVANLADIVIMGCFIATDLLYLSTEVVAVGYLLLIGVNHFQ